jgi:aldehyde:ferredoxin oxidoreductase
MKKYPLEKVKEAHEVLTEFPFEIVQLERGYSNRTLRIDLSGNEISTHPVSEQMKELWTGGKGFDLWLMFQEIDGNTKWNDPENPICFSPGPLGGTTSFPGSGKTLVTAISPSTHSIMDCNVGGYFGPYMKFAGFDALSVLGKAREDIIIVIDAGNGKITIEKAPLESIDSHKVCEALTEIYADDEAGKRHVTVVAAGRGAEHTNMGILNFSFYDWRRKFPRVKQAGRGGIGTVFRDKKIKAIVLKGREVKPPWSIKENKVARMVQPEQIPVQESKKDIEATREIIQKWDCDPEYVLEMMQDIQDRSRVVS